MIISSAVLPKASLTMKKIAVVLVTGWLCLCTFFMGGVPIEAAFAMPQPQSTSIAQTSMAEPPSLAAIEDFLHSMPNDYYTVKQISKLKGSIGSKKYLAYRCSRAI